MILVPENPPPEPTACDGTDSNNIRRCCRLYGPCLEGEGDCSRDSECAQGLRCGRNNCRTDFSSEEPTTFWKRGDEKIIDASQYRLYYRRAKGGVYNSRNHLR